MTIDRKLSIVMVTLVTIVVIIAVVFTFISLNETTDTIVINSSKEINKQVILNYENYFTEVTNMANLIEAETKSRDVNDVTELNDIYQNYSNANTNIVSISLVSLDGNIVVTSHDGKLPATNISDLSWFTNAFRNEEIHFFSAPHKENVILNSDTDVISISKVVDYQENTTNLEGVLLIDVHTEKIETLGKQTNLGEKGHMIIIDENDKLIYSSTDDCLSSSCESLEWVQEAIIGADYTRINNNDFYANMNTISGTRWRIVTFVDVNIIGETQTETRTILIAILFTAVVISGIVGTSLTKQITSPLEKLTQHMLKFEHSVENNKIEGLSGQKEVLILANTYNNMIDEIRDLLDRLVDEQKAKRKSEFIALQTQINPHFLYNTLDSIVWLSEQGKNEDVIKMVVSLSRFFRISISRGKNIIPIEKELEHAENYLTIQKIRYVEKFSFAFDIDESIYKYSIVKLIIQPVIENAIYHGISSDTGEIKIKAYQNQESIIIEVQNSGYGLTEEQITDIYRKIKTDSNESVGLRNVYQRLKLYYGDEADMIISSELDEYTNVKIIIPKQEVYT